MIFLSKCSCGAKSGMRQVQEKDDRGNPVTVLRGNCVICDKALDEANGQYISGPRGVPELEPDLLEIL